MKIIKLFLFLLACAVSVSCGGENDLVSTEDGSDGSVPRWYEDIPENQEFYYGKGSGASGLMDAAYTKAYASAKHSLAESIRSNIKSKIRNAVKINGSLEMDDEAIDTTFDSAIQLSSNLVLEGVVVYKQKRVKFNSGHRYFLAIRVDKKKVEETAARELKKAVKAKISDPRKSNNLNAMFDDDFFKEKK